MTVPPVFKKKDQPMSTNTMTRPDILKSTLHHVDQLPFVKMHGLGNDFVVLDKKDIPAGTDLAELTAVLCDRHFGVGADGLITYDDPRDVSCDVRFVYYNGDGSIAEMCGNGIRCFARFVYERGVVNKKEFIADTLAGPISPKINDDGTVTVNMGAPRFKANDMPFDVSKTKGDVSGEWIANHALAVTAEGKTTDVPISMVSMGNPHCLVFQEDLPSELDPAVYGPVMEVHPVFSNKTNVEFLTLTKPDTLKVVVWERGCGFTLACGTGACASAVGARRLGKTSSDRTFVELPGGTLTIDWNGDVESPVMMTGPAEYVFSGTINAS